MLLVHLIPSAEIGDWIILNVLVIAVRIPRLVVTFAFVQVGEAADERKFRLVLLLIVRSVITRVAGVLFMTLLIVVLLIEDLINRSMRRKRAELVGRK